MLKLIIGNKAYSSWSLRGWLAVKQSGLPFEEITVPLFDEDWNKRVEGDEFARSPPPPPPPPDPPRRSPKKARPRSR